MWVTGVQTCALPISRLHSDRCRQRVDACVGCSMVSGGGQGSEGVWTGGRGERGEGETMREEKELQL